MWLENLKELKKRSGMSAQQIADAANLPERTVSRILSGDTPDPRMDTIRRMVAVLDGSLDEVFAETDTVVGSKTLRAAQKELAEATESLSMARAEIAMLKDKVTGLEAENDRLRLTVAHKEEIISLHNYYLGRR